MTDDPYARERARAKALYDLRRWRECIAAMRRLLASNPQDADLHAYIAYALDELHEYKDALVDVDSALGIDPENEWYYRLRSSILTSLDRDDEALSAAREAVRCAPTGVLARGRLAHAAVTIGLNDEALEAADAAIRLGPQRTNAWSAKARALNAVGDRDGAIAAYRKVLAIDPENSYAHGELAWILEGDDGLAQARRALQVDPQSTYKMRGLADQLVEAERMDEALDVLRTAVATRPDGYAYWALGKTLVRAGRIDEAWESSARAIVDAEPSPWAWHTRVDAAGHRGDLAGARAALAEGLARHPPISPLLVTALRHLSLAEAVVVGEDGLRREPTAFWHHAMAVMRARQGRYDEALALCEMAMPRIYAWETLMDVAAGARRPELADRLPAKMPHAGPQVYATIRGHVARARGDWATAAAEYRAAIAIRKHCCATFGLAHALRELGEDHRPTLDDGRTRFTYCISHARHLAELG